MPKANPLSKGLASKGKASTSAKVAKAVNAAKGGNANGSGSPQRTRVLVGGHFAPAVQIELKIICAKERKTMQTLLTEALNMVLAKYGQPEIAGIMPEEESAA